MLRKDAHELTMFSSRILDKFTLTPPHLFLHPTRNSRNILRSSTFVCYHFASRRNSLPLIGSSVSSSGIFFFNTHRHFDRRVLLSRWSLWMFLLRLISNLAKQWRKTKDISGVFSSGSRNFIRRRPNVKRVTLLTRRLAA